MGTYALPSLAGDYVIFGADDGNLYAFKNSPLTATK